ncbi:MAG: nucleotidyltransferase domain-containing protein [Candidatus Sumerlaeota bacterium]|nr:nucleotidyltransferase domain-containing protein [Candidatus Sumerlaeota bacterium]
MTKEQILITLGEELPFLQREFGVKRLGLFGSYARGTQTDLSDVDIVAEFDRSIGLRFMEFSEHIEQVLGRRADILTPACISTMRNRKMAREIVKSCIYV